jgi:RpiB/LacA/LacB family sugar-phosphate isomerase
MKRGLVIVKSGGRTVPTGTHEGKTVIIGSDHRGFALKNTLKRGLVARGFRVVDAGPRTPAKTDYPLIAIRIARGVGPGEGRRAVGIGICGSGIGMMIPAAKIPGVHPANPATPAMARTTRLHNNSNFLSLSAERLDAKRALAIALAWLTSPFYTDPIRHASYLRRYIQTARLDDKGQHRQRSCRRWPQGRK